MFLDKTQNRVNVNLENEKLKTLDQFSYLGSVIIENELDKNEVTSRISKASVFTTR